MAVMIDPFNPVQITTEATKIELPEYYQSWMSKNQEVIA